MLCAFFTAIRSQKWTDACCTVLREAAHWRAVTWHGRAKDCCQKVNGRLQCQYNEHSHNAPSSDIVTLRHLPAHCNRCDRDQTRRYSYSRSTATTLYPRLLEQYSSRFGSPQFYSSLLMRALPRQMLVCGRGGLIRMPFITASQDEPPSY